LKRFDARGCAVSGSTPSALDAWERALARWRAWRSGAEAELEAAVEDAPGFVMAHVLRAWLLVASRDPRSVRRARPLVERAKAWPADAHERTHLAALDAAMADDLERAKALLGALLLEAPRDAVALQVVHGLDYLTGDLERLADRVARVRPFWSREVPGHHAVLAMHAFGLEESGESERATDAALEALALDATDARAHHVIAHVHESAERPDEGARWLERHAGAWSNGTLVATHAWWHLALFRLALGDAAGALAIHDAQLQASDASSISDLIDASALLWRLRLAGVDVGPRWRVLSDAWALHVEDRYCSFNDLHAMLAFVGAGDGAQARRLERVLRTAQAAPTRHGHTTRDIGLPACRAVMAFGRGEPALAVTLLASLPGVAHRIGGSHAQRDVLHLTLLHAVDSLRRPQRRATAALTP
jgi:hypothetical protein